MPMLLSNRQQEIIRLLQEFGPLSLIQLERLLALTFPPESIKLEPMLRQLAMGGMARWVGQYVFPQDTVHTDPVMHEALDTMLALAPQGLQQVQRGTPPFILTFFRDREGKLYRYDICPVSAARLPVIGAQLEGIPQKYRVIVFLLQDLGLKDVLAASYLDIPCEHCFSIRTRDGIRFYKKEVKQDESD